MSDFMLCKIHISFIMTIYTQSEGIKNGKQQKTKEQGLLC